MYSDDMTKQPLSLILTVGIVASGKSTWANIVAADHDMLVVNMDSIRADLCGDASDQSRNKEVYSKAEALVHEGLESGRSVIFDATSRTPKTRKHLIKIGKAYGARLIGVYFKADIVGCKIRNAARDRKVPDSVIDIHQATLVPPSTTEGLDEVQIANVDHESYTPVLL